MRLVTTIFAAVTVLNCSFPATAQNDVSVELWEASCRFHDTSAFPPTPAAVGIESVDHFGVTPFSLVPNTTGAFSLTGNTSPGLTVNVEWQGTFTDHGPGGYFDDFAVQSTGPLFRPSTLGLTHRCYRPAVALPETNTAIVLFDLGGDPFGAPGGDPIFIEGDPAMPVRSVRLEMFETAAGGAPIGEMVHSMMYLQPSDVEPFMNIRNLHHEPMHYRVSTGTFDAPVGIGDHDDYAALLGMVSDGVIRTLPAAGDFDENGQYDASDMDALSVQLFEIANGVAPDLRYDINGDGIVDTGDAERWLANAGAVHNPNGGPFLPSDGNLDGVVDGSDFILWNAHKFSNTPLFTKGDWNYDGVVDGSDFILWNAHKFSASDVVAAGAVPEPSSAISLVLSMVGLVLLNAQSRRGKTNA